ncbi:hypothetical protein FTV88_1008 [Heliorestis convoluta]|uniref:Uncharacterized protein n=1 Tax=Heliorestis convoluta TaxID=356322 RepID=A0A5Q2N4H6_9FIRM|nr:hypothetical protein FTV88_1008 [Heliorestis convoluta]
MFFICVLSIQALDKMIFLRAWEGDGHCVTNLVDNARYLRNNWRKEEKI